jgi:hypothetical protein
MLKLHVDDPTHFIEMSDLEYGTITIRHFRDKDGIAHDDRRSQSQRNKLEISDPIAAKGKVMNQGKAITDASKSLCFWAGVI